MRHVVCKIVLVLIAVLAIVSMVGCVSAEGEDLNTSTTDTPTDEPTDESTDDPTDAPTETPKITSISISGLTAPVKGATPVSTCTVTTSPQNDALEESTVLVTWKESAGSQEATAFKAGTVYIANIKIYAKTGYDFASSPTINGCSPGSSSFVKSSPKGEITITYPATQSDDAAISSVSLSGVTAPVKGATAATTGITVTSSSGPTSIGTLQNLGWYEGSTSVTETFGENKEYKLKFKITAQDGYKFTSSTTFTDGTNTGSVTLSNSDKTAEVTIPYPKTGFTINSLTISGIKPVEGKFPSDITTATVTTDPENGVASAPVTWDTSSKFTSGTSYKATIVLTAKDNVEFKSSKPTVKIDDTTVPDKDVTVSADKKTLTVEYTYSSVASVSSSTIKLTLSPIPESGKSVPKSATIDSSTTGVEKAEVSWTPSTDKFETGKEYTAKITLTPKADFVLDTSKEVYLNDEKVPASDKSMDGSKLVITKKYAGLVITSVALTVTKPEEGNVPSKYANVSSPTSGVKINGDVTWNPSTSKFESDYNYFATVPVKAESGNMFTKDTKFTINGAEATIDTLSSDGTEAKIKSGSMSLAGISEVQFTLAAPKANGAPGSLTIISPTSGVTSKVTWSPELTNNKFAENTVYTAVIEFTTTDKFVSNAKAVWNGDNQEAKISSDKKTMTVTHQFSNTGKVTAAPTNSPTPAKTQTSAPRPNIDTETKQAEDEGEDGEEDELFFPNPLNMLSEFLELFYALFDPATYGIEIEEDDGGAQDKDKDKEK